ncbi:MAG: 16S rRNA (cytidine(1402)-2'-O)-methyltransferase [Syntrophomonadaceae bacterium]|nr:16S rRNA (cytidine(1402)-2'-O)-methyltransferase [Syntrophomonadaceae bacterium]
MSGKLYICGTPIGNLEDVTVRLLKTLRAVDVIACEDTRHTIKLLNRYHIKKPLISYHQHSDQHKENHLIELLISGKNVALVTDAGMPGISDPGTRLIKSVIKAEIEIEVIPGPSAVIAALTLSGMDTDSFVFMGFLPVKAGQRRTALQKLQQESKTIVFYEAPHRLENFLQVISEVMGSERQIAIARELTKIHEQVFRGTIEEAQEYFQQNPARGELTIVLAGKVAEIRAASLHEIAAEVQQLLDNGMHKKEALKKKAGEYGISKSSLYNYVEKNRTLKD